jgi:hypothetical protein
MERIFTFTPVAPLYRIQIGVEWSDALPLNGRKQGSAAFRGVKIGSVLLRPRLMSTAESLIVKTALAGL